MRCVVAAEDGLVPYRLSGEGRAQITAIRTPVTESMALLRPMHPSLSSEQPEARCFKKVLLRRFIGRRQWGLLSTATAWSQLRSSDQAAGPHRRPRMMLRAFMTPSRRSIIQTPIAYQGFVNRDCSTAHPSSTLTRRVSVPTYDRSALVASGLQVVVRGFGCGDRLAYLDNFFRRCISDDDEELNSALRHLGQLACHPCDESLACVCEPNWLVAWPPMRLLSSSPSSDHRAVGNCSFVPVQDPRDKLR
jgi:hypothetical protein